jgi:hypothetical protein
MAGGNLWFSPPDFCLCPADARDRRLSLPDRQGQNALGRAILAGFGLLFIGIEYLQTGMEGISWNLDAVGGSGFGWQWILAGVGILMSVVMQSSSAAAATTLVALHAGSLTFQQACAMIVGQSVGTAATSALVAIGAGLAVRRAALAHIIYNVSMLLSALLGSCCSNRSQRRQAGWVLDWTIQRACWLSRRLAASSSSSGLLHSFHGLMVSHD